jgi:hypothetical protein
MSIDDKYMTWFGLASLLDSPPEKVGEVQLPKFVSLITGQHLSEVQKASLYTDAFDPYPDYRLKLCRLDGQINRLIKERDALERTAVKECVHNSLPQNLKDKECPFKRMWHQCHTKSETDVCVVCEHCQTHLHIRKE